MIPNCLRPNAYDMRLVPKFSLFVLVGIGVLGLLFVGFGREYVRNRQIENEIAALQSEHDRLEESRLASLELIEDLSSEYYLEREARMKRGLGEPGETLVVVDLHDQEAAEGVVLGAAVDDGLPNSTRWFYYFFDPVRFAELRSL